ncbi:MAG: bifunctional hydroxymethylpyrimidine kinase/phosphomethylpyrimidine kinase [Roseofilum sp. SBFL]|uniref:bifunctional hydroxymethylpyrimidine kinase/phosphomethylpyrimidine kinase n=1 Tax=unclassified Roseofilum TaxID=2620099 RepID=UPI001B15736E|nr:MULTISPECIES: bifunctional hydroxymethylpyrimidine kinase/phosphomethylpyrimidine kinase [unclassified Roseofilum]MBP0013201.1 bifunctional hydroxymethylpyrimidine kinase/phosphomethylpyrimidine kinase [Roseofilum sp. SID3]MBP0022927.1 bifunctional hydroxymethylpyrimidine kinase/phosphomethylpyrimidine kinase [Roseofilum sp. SID2]MBP0036196.1 bifunctional hydroxymethylpyrimidine kinase/phosphomethylpyrimidine kinase [Roseofilum sp. SID1]MBP0042907.1 bifunctional hydroxymethylpyrimidine kinas
MNSNIPVVLTIAGSDSGGGAGIQADLRTLAFHCVHGASALTCVTAQNTLAVNRVDALSPEAVLAQLEAVVGDMGVQAVKTGMLLNAEIMQAVSDRLRSLDLHPLVVDPVMVSRSGDRLIDRQAVETLQQELIPQATVVTPNRYEAQLLTGVEISSIENMKEAAETLKWQSGVQAVLIKGGGMTGELRGVDVLLDDREITVLETECIDTSNTHGTGCTLSAAIAANLATGHSISDAVRQAKNYVTEALKWSLDIGQGTGPVGHFFPLCLN